MSAHNGKVTAKGKRALSSGGDKQSTTEIGKAGEDFVTRRLVSKGYEIVDRNVNEKVAEIDIVARKRNTICFIEVRSRQHTRLGHPLETIDDRKKQHIRKAAELYLARNWPKYKDLEIRFDVAALVWETREFTYLPNAF